MPFASKSPRRAAVLCGPWGRKASQLYGTGRRSGNWYRCTTCTAGRLLPDWKERTTPVGVYPQGASIEGVLDLAGNVDEWCLNKHDHPEVIEADTSRDSRMLRGGSWYGNPDSVRSAERNWTGPREQVDNVGFRLVSSNPIF